MKQEENSGLEFAPQNEGGYLAQETGVNTFDTNNTCPKYWSRNVNSRFQKKDRVQLRERVIEAWKLDTLSALPNEEPFEYLLRRACRFSDLRDRIVEKQSTKGKRNRRKTLKKESLQKKCAAMREWEKWLDPIKLSSDNLDYIEEDLSNNAPEFSEEMAIEDLYNLFNDASQKVSKCESISNW